jgi:hypothetical protein
MRIAKLDRNTTEEVIMVLLKTPRGMRLDRL